jgi:hypothetical protein
MHRIAVTHRVGRACSIVLCLLGLVVTLACAGTPEDKPLRLETGPDAETTPDGLVRAKGSKFDDLWVKPGADIASYDALLIGNVRIAYKRKPNSRRYSITGSNFALDARQAKELQDLLRQALVKQIDESKSWTLADAAGPGVLLIEPGLIDLVVKVPTDAPPNSNTYTTSAGEVTLMLELRDSETQEILARVADRKEARRPGSGPNNLYWSNPINNKSAVQSMFRRWARILMARLDTAHRIGASASADAAGGAP